MNEVEQVRRQYEKGEFAGIQKDLETFIRRNRGEILRFKEQLRAGRRGRSVDDALAVKLYILKVRSINPRREIEEQLHLIEREREKRCVREGRPLDPHQVAMDWARMYSPAWRSHRVTAIIYTFDRNRDRYLSLLT